MKNVNTKTSAGYDNISPCFIKIAANELAYKRAETSSLYKAKDKYRKDNYRPVSCLTTISKIVEYELCNQTNDHFISLFDDKLSAFRKGICCEQVLINFTVQ